MAPADSMADLYSRVSALNEGVSAREVENSCWYPSGEGHITQVNQYRNGITNVIIFLGGTIKFVDGIYMYNDELLKLIISSFSSVGSLEKHYSLADTDFYDSNRFYPNNENAKELLSKYPYGYLGWDEETVNFITRQVNNSITFKNEAWDQVKPDYLRKHFHGILYLDSHSYLYYLSAWMYQFVKGEEETLDICSDWMLSTILTSTLCNGNDTKLEALDGRQRKTVRRFLEYIYKYNGIEYEDAKECLDKGWNSY